MAWGGRRPIDERKSRKASSKTIWCRDGRSKTATPESDGATPNKLIFTAPAATACYIFCPPAEAATTRKTNRRSTSIQIAPAKRSAVSVRVNLQVPRRLPKNRIPGSPHSCRPIPSAVTIPSTSPNRLHLRRNPTAETRDTNVRRPGSSVPVPRDQNAGRRFGTSRQLKPQALIHRNAKLACGFFSSTAYGPSASYRYSTNKRPPTCRFLVTPHFPDSFPHTNSWPNFSGAFKKTCGPVSSTNRMLRRRPTTPSTTRARGHALKIPLICSSMITGLWADHKMHMAG